MNGKALSGRLQSWLLERVTASILLRTYRSAHDLGNPIRVRPEESTMACATQLEGPYRDYLARAVCYFG